MRCAVVGGGLFGSTAALHLARAGHAVYLYEAKGALMQGATASTYSRLHRGYHYPRSPQTGAESRAAEAAFRAEYGASVIDGGRQFYVIAEEDGARVTPDEYQTFLEGEKLRFYRDKNLFRVVEPRIDLAHLGRQVRAKIDASPVIVHYHKEPCGKFLRAEFDQIVLATYADLNFMAGDLDCRLTPYRYQVVERPVVFLPASFDNTSFVILDGPFGCIDPLDDSSMHVLGHVTETIHVQNTGEVPVIPTRLKDVIGRGVLAAESIGEVTNFDKVVAALAHFLPSVAKAAHIGSSFVVRAVLADQEATDARPTVVERLDDQVIRLFSGKLGTACKAAQDVVAMVEGTKVPETAEGRAYAHSYA